MKVSRFHSIDIFRAITMLLMIFVNDLWTLTDIPGWLEHKAANEDGLGLADVVFPAFLFIVGLSIPWAIEARFNKGHSRMRILKHIAERSVALLIMGVFMVNLENINASELPINKNYWQILMTLAFFMIWNNYREKVLGRIPPNVLKIAGWCILIFLAVIYKGGTADNPLWMRTHWWGILGLIGWGYLVNALLYLGLRHRLGWMVLVTIVFYFLNVNESISLFGFDLKIVVSASNHVSVMTGMLVTIILINLQRKRNDEISGAGPAGTFSYIDRIWICYQAAMGDLKDHGHSFLDSHMCRYQHSFLYPVVHHCRQVEVNQVGRYYCPCGE